MNDPARDEWQKPWEVIAALAFHQGVRVADLGAGGGYFTWCLADAVEPQGAVVPVSGLSVTYPPSSAGVRTAVSSIVRPRKKVPQSSCIPRIEANDYMNRLAVC